jgi:hypothetical protein
VANFVKEHCFDRAAGSPPDVKTALLHRHIHEADVPYACSRTNRLKIIILLVGGLSR